MLSPRFHFNLITSNFYIQSMHQKHFRNKLPDQAFKSTLASQAGGPSCFLFCLIRSIHFWPHSIHLPLSSRHSVGYFGAINLYIFANHSVKKNNQKYYCFYCNIIRWIFIVSFKHQSESQSLNLLTVYSADALKFHFIVCGLDTFGSPLSENQWSVIRITIFSPPILSTVQRCAQWQQWLCAANTLLGCLALKILFLFKKVFMSIALLQSL